MKFSNFREYKQSGEFLDKKEYAVVDKTTGFLWWKTTVPVTVCKPYYAHYWKFTSTGEFTPGHQVEALERA